jgi:hypothetical protein
MNSRRIIGNPLKKLPKEHKFAVEIRNKDWLVPKLADALREHAWTSFAIHNNVA